MMKCAGIYNDMESIHDLVTKIYENAWSTGINAELRGENFMREFTKELRHMQFVLEGALQSKAVHDLKEFNDVPDEEF